MIGRFISFEGGEGVGKSTQIKAIEQALRASGVELIVTREPGGSAGAEAIRTLLMEGADDRWSARAEALLFAAARADHVEKVIGPALKRGLWVLCDRYVDSTRAYQGGGGGLTDDDIMCLHHIGTGGLMPDRSFLLTLSAEKAAARLRLRDVGGADRMGSKTAAYQQRLAQRFEELARNEPDRWRVIDADQIATEVTKIIMTELKAWLP